MIRHVVTWKLKAEDDEGRSRAFAEIADGLGSLPPLIPEIKSLQIGRDVGGTAANWDVVLIVDYANVDDLEIYQTHPEHLKVVAAIKSHFAGRAAVDFEL